jgi:hypothetical protein
MYKVMMGLAMAAMAAGCCDHGDVASAPGSVRIEVRQQGAGGAEVRKAAAKSWTLAEGFSATANPNGPWSWGQCAAGDAGAFRPFSWHGLSPKGPTVWAMTGYTGDMLYGAHIWKNDQTHAIGAVVPGEISFHPGPNHEKAVVRWTSPVAGPVRIRGSFGQGDTGNVDVSVLKTNGDGTVTGNLFEVRNTASGRKFDLTTNVAAGETIDFVLGDAGDWVFDNTPIDVTITADAAEPARKAAAE